MGVCVEGWGAGKSGGRREESAARRPSPTPSPRIPSERCEKGEAPRSSEIERVVTRRTQCEERGGAGGGGGGERDEKTKLKKKKVVKEFKNGAEQQKRDREV